MRAASGARGQSGPDWHLPSPGASTDPSPDAGTTILNLERGFPRTFAGGGFAMARRREYLSVTVKTKGGRDGFMVVAGGFMMLLGLVFATWSGIKGAAHDGIRGLAGCFHWPCYSPDK